MCACAGSSAPIQVVRSQPLGPGGGDSPLAGQNQSVIVQVRVVEPAQVAPVRIDVPEIPALRVARSDVDRYRN